MSSKQQTLLGLLGIVAMTMLGYYTLFLNDVNLFGEVIKMRVQFPLANELRKGDAVFVAGIRVGRVKEIGFNAYAERKEQRVTVLIHLDEKVPLFTDYIITIEESTLLGGRKVSIAPGLAAKPEISFDGDVILQGRMGKSPMDAFEKLSQMIDSNSGSFTNTMANIETISAAAASGQGTLGKLLNDEGLATQFEAAVGDLQSFAADAKDVSNRIASGEGTVGKLIYSDSLHSNFESTLGDLKSILGDLKGGKGVIGRALHDEELADEVTAFVNNLSAISADLEAGEGSIGKLLKDDTAANSIEAASANIATLTERIVNGEGTIGALFASDELYATYRDFGARIERIAASIEEGDGSIGQLLNSSEFYDELMVGLRLLNRSLEDYREQAPVTAFTSALFSIF